MAASRTRAYASAWTACASGADAARNGRTVAFGGRDWPYWDAATWMAPAGDCFLPATVVPVGMTSAGLPVGIQIVGPYLHDRTTLDVAGHVTALVGGCPRPPGF